MQFTNKMIRALVGTSIVAAGVLAATSTARADALYTDEFNYTLGANLNNGSTGGWFNQGFGNLSQLSATVGTGLSFPGLVSTGGSALLSSTNTANNQFPINSLTDTDNYYVSALFSKGTNTGRLSVAFRQGWNSSYIAGFGLTGTGRLTVGDGTFNGGTWVQSPTQNVVVAGTTALLVAYIDQTAKTISVYNVTDLSLGLPALPDLTYTYTNVSAPHQIEVNFNNNGTTTSNRIDEVRLGLSLADVLPLATPPGGTSWKSNISGDWQTAGNWNGPTPNGVDVVANLGNVIGTAQTVYTNTAITLGTLNFDSSNGYILGGMGAVILQTTSGNAAMNVLSGNHVISTTGVEFKSSTDIAVADGSNLTIGGLQNGVVIDAGKVVTKTATTGTLTILGTLNVGTGSQLVLTAAADWKTSKALSVGAITGSGTIDLGTSSLVLKNTTLSSLLSMMGSGKIFSSAVAGDGSLVLGTLSGADYVAVNGSSFLGQTVAAGDAVARYTWAGDVTLDGKITGVDFAQIDASYLLGTYAAGGALWVNGDFDNDGKVTLADFALIDASFYLSTGYSPAALARVASDEARFGAAFTAAFDAAVANSVPEPASLSLLGLGVVALLKRRK